MLNFKIVYDDAVPVFKLSLPSFASQTLSVPQCQSLSVCSTQREVSGDLETPESLADFNRANEVTERTIRVV